jgi:hypothetical protein
MSTLTSGLLACQYDNFPQPVRLISIRGVAFVSIAATPAGDPPVLKNALSARGHGPAPGRTMPGTPVWWRGISVPITASDGDRLAEAR